jgi:hypothetical protein
VVLSLRAFEKVKLVDSQTASKADVVTLLLGGIQGSLRKSKRPPHNAGGL